MFLADYAWVPSIEAVGTPGSIRSRRLALRRGPREYGAGAASNGARSIGSAVSNLRFSRWFSIAAGRPIPEGEAIMTVARVTKITASSTKGFQDAVQAALARATKTLHGITGLEVLSQKAKIEDGKIAEYRVTVELTFILD
jgi:dodecin